MGRKQSPFIGRRVPLVDNGVPILYPRYTAVADIVLDGAAADKKRAAPEPNSTPADAAAAVAAAANGVAAPAEQPAAKKSKKDKKQAAAEQQQQQPQAADANGAADAAAPDQQQQKALSQKEQKRLQQQQHEKEQQAAAAKRQLLKKEKKKQRQLQQQQEREAAGLPDPQQQQQQQQQAVPEAAGNAEEAARMRQVLGFSAGSTTQPAATAAPKAAGGGFSFNFAALSTEEAVAADTEAKLAAIKAVDTADKDGYVPRRVFVGGMPYSYSQEQVAEYWGWCGDIEELDIMTFPDTGRFRGIAFITFKTQEGADAALACNGEQVDGQTLKVEKAKATAVAKSLKATAASTRNQQQSQRSRQQQEQHTPNGDAPVAAAAAAAGATGEGPARTPGYNVAYVGNIAFEARPEDISALFDSCNVTKVRLHTDKDTRKSKGYAHVHFADDAGLEQAISMSGTQFMGRPIKVSFGQPKKN